MARVGAGLVPARPGAAATPGGDRCGGRGSEASPPRSAPESGWVAFTIGLFVLRLWMRRDGVRARRGGVVVVRRTQEHRCERAASLGASPRRGSGALRDAAPRRLRASAARGSRCCALRRRTRPPGSVRLGRCRSVRDGRPAALRRPRAHRPRWRCRACGLQPAGDLDCAGGLAAGRCRDVVSGAARLANRRPSRHGSRRCGALRNPRARRADRSALGRWCGHGRDRRSSSRSPAPLYSELVAALGAPLRAEEEGVTFQPDGTEDDDERMGRGGIAVEHPLGLRGPHRQRGRGRLRARVPLPGPARRDRAQACARDGAAQSRRRGQGLRAHALQRAPLPRRRRAARRIRRDARGRTRDLPRQRGPR